MEPNTVSSVLLLIVFLPAAIFFLVPFFARGMKSLLIVYLIFGGIICFVWITVIIAMSQPGFRQSLGGVADLGIFALMTMCFVASAIPRTVVLWLRERGSSSRIGWWLHGFAVAGVIAVVGFPSANMAYAKRPPPEACLDKPIPLQVAGVSLDLPHAPIIEVEPWRRLGGSPSLGPKEMRTLCEKTQNGANRIDFDGVSIRFASVGYYHTHKSDWCQRTTTEWEKAACDSETRKSLPSGIALYDPAVPTNVSYRKDTHSLFITSRENGGQFKGSMLLDASGEKRFIVSADRRTPDGMPMTAFCPHHANDRQPECFVDYALENGLRLNWSFRAKPEDAERRFTEMQTTVEDISQTLFTKHE